MDTLAVATFEGVRGMTQEELKECLRLHKLWLDNNATGTRANLSGAYLARADLARADLAGAYLAEANLSEANLAEANLARAYLAEANLARAYLAGADLSGANLARADLSGANLAGTLLDGKAVLSFQFKKHTAFFFGDKEHLRIGCHDKPVSEWLETFKAVGEEEGYLEEEITKYGEFIALCAKM